jgi:hypothetical protein
MPASIGHETPRRLTPQELLRLAKDEYEHRQVNIDWTRQCDAAAAEVGFSGDLRRAINESRLSPFKLAEIAAVEVGVLEDFRGGAGPLPSDAIDRLACHLQLRLVAAETAAS